MNLINNFQSKFDPDNFQVEVVYDPIKKPQTIGQTVSVKFLRGLNDEFIINNKKGMPYVVRAGSGFLYRFDKWNFCLTLA